ncbi:MAG: hypothetical protein RLZ59_928 [Pseudomonadota bacterium]
MTRFVTRHPELVSGSLIAVGAGSAPSCSWMLNQVQHDARGAREAAE